VVVPLKHSFAAPTGFVMVTDITLSIQKETR